jgi:hypothetical protein
LNNTDTLFHEESAEKEIISTKREITVFDFHDFIHEIRSGLSRVSRQEKERKAQSIDKRESVIIPFFVVVGNKPLTDDLRSGGVCQTLLELRLKVIKTQKKTSLRVKVKKLKEESRSRENYPKSSLMTSLMQHQKQEIEKRLRQLEAFEARQSN